MGFIIGLSMLTKNSGAILAITLLSTAFYALSILEVKIKEYYNHSLLVQSYPLFYGHHGHIETLKYTIASSQQKKLVI